MSPKLSPILCAVAAGLLACAPAAADEAQDAFDVLYGAQARAAAETKSFTDDVDLAGKLLDAARAAPHHKGFFVMLCRNAYDLSAQSPDGYDTALAAMDLMAAKAPELAPDAAQKKLAVLDRRFTTARFVDKVDAAQALLPVLLAVAESSERAGDFAGAEALYRKAKVAAAAARADRTRDAVDKRIDQVVERKRLAARLDKIKVDLEADANNPQAVAELLTGYVVELDQPAKASPYAALSRDASMQRLAPIAARDLYSVPTDRLIELGDWYSKLFAGASASARPAMIARARGYYERFLQRHHQADLSRDKAMLALRELDANGRALPDDAIPAAEEWFDLLQLVDYPDAAQRANWTVRDGQLTSVAAAADGRVQLAVAPRGDYELRTTFTRHSGSGSVNVILPIGNRQVLLMLSGWGGRASGLYSIDPASEKVQRVDGYRRNVSTVTPGSLINDRRNTLDVQVRRRAGQVGVAVDLNGKSIIRWQGEESQPTLWAAWALPATNTLGLGATSKTTFHTARLKMLSGDMSLLRPLPPKQPVAQYLAVKQNLDVVYLAKKLPSQADPPWRYSGTGIAENRAALVKAGSVILVDTEAQQQASWVNDASPGFGSADPAVGLSAQIDLQIVKAPADDRGFDLELYVGDGKKAHRRAFISVTASAVLWFAAGQFTALATDLNNSDASHVYRLSMRPDGYVQIYRDSDLLAVRPPDASVTGAFEPAGPYLRWGDGSLNAESDALVRHVSYDLTGPYQPPAR